MGFVKGQHEEWKARQDAGELDPNQKIAAESAVPADTAAASADAPVDPAQYEEQHAPQQ